VTGDSAAGLLEIYPDWPQHADRIVAGIRELNTARLGLRAGTDHAPIWTLAAHVAGTRTYWLCHVFGEPGAGQTPFADPTGDGWEDDLDHPRGLPCRRDLAAPRHAWPAGDRPLGEAPVALSLAARHHGG